VRFVGSSDRDRARPTVPHDVRFEEAQHGEGSAESRVECVVRQSGRLIGKVPIRMIDE
jgi:hypothetical protein